MCGCTDSINGVELVDDRVVLDMSMADAFLSPLLGGAGFLLSNEATYQWNQMRAKNSKPALDGNYSGIAKIGLGALTGFLSYRYAGDFAVPGVVAGFGMGLSGGLDIARQNLDESTQKRLGLAGINAMMLNRPAVRRKKQEVFEELTLEAA